MPTEFKRTDFLPETTQTLRYLLKTDWELVFEKSRYILLNAGDVLIHEGNPSEGLYFLHSGQVRVEQVRQGLNIVLSHREPGAVLGEVALLGVSPAMASVVATEMCEVYLAERHELMALLTSIPGLATRFYLSLAALLAERLTESTAMMRQAQTLPGFAELFAEEPGEVAERLSRFLL